MARTRFKWQCIFFSYILLINVFTKSLPINTQLSSLTTTDTVFKSSEIPIVIDDVEEFVETYSETIDENKNVTVVEVPVNATRDAVFRQVRPGQEVSNYAVEITADISSRSFNGRAVLDVFLDQATREDPIVLHVENLDIMSVKVGVFSAANAADVGFGVDDGILEIYPDSPASSFIVIIEYSGQLANGGMGLHLGQYDQDTYLAMNLHPTYARRVFPCMDEPTEVSIISFTFNNLQYTHMIANSMLEENSVSQFRALQGPPHLWGMVAHNFININIPTSNVLLYGRPGLTNQDAQASVAINSFFNNLNEWTEKPYLEIILNQDGRLNILALPDVSRDWTALSTIGIWEPYIFMEPVHSVKQRKTALVKIAESIAKQWFGYVIFAENWRFEWVVSGLASYAGYEMVKLFQGDFNIDSNQLDVNTLFVTDVIQESLLRDSYQNSQVLEPESDLFNEDAIRDHMNGLLKYKAPALMRMMRLVLGDANNDFIQAAGRALLNVRSLQTVNSLFFIDALNSEYLSNNNGMVPDIAEYLEPWILNNGYPLVRIDLRQGIGVAVSQGRFGFNNKPHIDFDIPITYTTSIELNFDDDRIYPVQMTGSNINIPVSLGDEDWVLFNIQGQGYYRVTYDDVLWERIIEALQDPDRRAEIHPLNRATLVDDSLNVARSGILDYDVAFRVVLSMEHETEYAVWKAFVRNMNFLRKRLIALVTLDEDLDPDIYLRMVRRTIISVENELSFYPDLSLTEPAMTTLTRGLVMDHACRANYQPCIAAAVDWFYDPNNNEVVNPDIPHELRPAVYCTMAREGDADVIAALYARLEIEQSHYERVVILESLACSQDADFIRSLLLDTILTDSPFGVEERVRIFKAVAESSFQNAGIAVNFIATRTVEVRNMYGGPEKLEEVIFALAENMVEDDLVRDFREWVTSQNNFLDDSQVPANRALELVQENIQWNAAYMEYVYEWIDENHAPTIVLSVMALCVSLMVTLFNH